MQITFANLRHVHGSTEVIEAIILGGLKLFLYKYCNTPHQFLVPSLSYLVTILHIFTLGSYLKFTALELLIAYIWHIFALSCYLKFVASEFLLAYLWHIFGISLAYICNYRLYDYPFGLGSSVINDNSLLGNSLRSMTCNCIDEGIRSILYHMRDDIQHIGKQSR